MQKITPFLWFNIQAEEAVDFYVAVFKNSKIYDISRYSHAAAKASGMPEESVMTISFELNGQKFVALNGGPHFQFNPSVSFVISCKNQQEIDYYWEKLTQGGTEEQCGWLRDKFGLSWQVVPANIDELMKDPDPVKSERAMNALLKMKKLDMQKLEDAFYGSKVNTHA